MLRKPYNTVNWTKSTGAEQFMSHYSTAFVYHAWLSSAMIPPERMSQLMAEYGNPERVFSAFSERDPKLDALLQPAERMRLSANAGESFLVRMDALMKLHSICAFTCMDDDVYPSLLKEIPDPPAILFYQGNVSCLSGRLLSIVGSRSASYNGRKTTRNLARDLSNRGITIVSGLAGGIDTAAHRGCLEGKSPTIAVTGCGLDCVYPADNLALRDEILAKGGLILSEFTPGEKPLGWHFPVRNRILTGLSVALVLMEAQIRSGSMTSVRHALDQGRDVFVYPGDPTSVHFEGNHQLLREGGIYFTTALDILEDLRWLDNPSCMGQNSDCAPDTPSMSKEEQSVVSALRPGPLGFEALSGATGLAPAVLLSTLTMLQLRGAVEALPGKAYQLNR